MSAATEFYKGLYRLSGSAKGAGRALRELKREEAESRNAVTRPERRSFYSRTPTRRRSPVVDMNMVNDIIARIDELRIGREEELDQLVEARRAERAAKKEQGQ